MRLCKYDQGIENIMIWRNYEKARLNCSITSSKFDNSNNYFTLVLNALNSYQPINCIEFSYSARQLFTQYALNYLVIYNF